MKERVLSGMVAVGMIAMVGLGMMPAAALANAKGVPNNPKVVTPVATGVVDQNLPETPAVNAANFGGGSGTVTANVVTPAVARLDVFSDPSYSTVGSSGLSINVGVHSFITVKNISSGTIQIGMFNVPAGGTVSLGTWGLSGFNHIGLWYDREEYLVKNQAAYGGRINVGWLMTQAQLNSLNSYIIYHGDVWTSGLNCSDFAFRAWNAAVDPAYNILPSTITPKGLADAIKAKFPNNYGVGYSVPYNYVVYYANGAGAPTYSSLFP